MLALVLAMAGPIVAASDAATGEGAESFPDAASHWAAGAIAQARAAGYVAGYPDGTFRPERPVSKAELVKMLVAALGLELRSAGSTGFTDTAGHWLEEQGWLGAAAAAGIVDPDADGPRFEPTATALRRQALVLTVRAAGGADDAQRASRNGAAAEGYRDGHALGELSGYASVAVRWGIMRGYPDGEFKPDRPLTRAEAVVLVQRVLDITGGAIGTWPRYHSPALGIVVRHPPGWTPDARDSQRLAGSSGFLQVNAAACGPTLDDVVRNEVEHKLTPYGRGYRIETVTAAGREGRLILPGPDQDLAMAGQAALVVPYPAPWRIGDTDYCYLVIYADAGHVRYLAEGLEFAGEGPSESAPEPSVLQGHGRLALVREGRLYLVDGETGATRLLDDSGQAAGPAFSHDGQWIAYVRRAPGLAGGSLVLAPVEGGEPDEVRGLPVPVAPGEYAWAPGHHALAVAPGGRGQGGGLWLIEPRAAARHLVTAAVDGLAWSPDGTSLAYVVALPLKDAAGDPAQRGSELRVIDIASGASTARYRAERAGIILAGWWPDGRGLVFWLDPYHSASLAADGLPLLALAPGETEPRQLAITLPRRAWVVWLPEAAGSSTEPGRFVTVDGAGRFLWEHKRLVLCNAAEAQCQALPAGEGTVAFDPDVAPDGRRIAFVAAPQLTGIGAGPEEVERWSQERVLRLMNLETGAVQTLPAVGRGIGQPRWAADGRHLLFTRDDGIWLLSLENGEPRRVAALPEPGDGPGSAWSASRLDFAWWPGEP
ncbi:MAG TPA: S-layer homology domain-containing protein [Bacillota bacterium]